MTPPHTHTYMKKAKLVSQHLQSLCVMDTWIVFYYILYIVVF